MNEFIKHAYLGIFDPGCGCRERHLKFLFCLFLGMRLLGGSDNMQLAVGEAVRSLEDSAGVGAIWAIDLQRYPPVCVFAAGKQWVEHKT